jgi:hypothetical protein
VVPSADVPTYVLTRENTSLRAFDPDLEESASYQRLVAALVESESLPMEPDPCLRGADWQAGEDLLALRIDLV